MTEDSAQQPEQEPRSRPDDDETGDRGTRERVSDGIRSGIGVLSAFKDALEETIHDARERGDLSAERARELMKGALGKAQAAASEARERLDFANQKEIEELERAVEALTARVAVLEERVLGATPTADAGTDADEEEATDS